MSTFFCCWPLFLNEVNGFYDVTDTWDISRILFMEFR